MFTMKAFTFSADCKTLEQSIKRVSAVVGPNSAYYLAVFKKSVCVLGLGIDSFALLAVPNAVTDSSAGTFSFAFDTMIGLIRGRSVMDFKFDGTKCLFKQSKGTYKGELNSLPITEDQSTQLAAKVSEKAATGSSIPAPVLSHIKQCLAATSIADVYQASTLTSFITLTKDGHLSVSSFDAQHFGLARTKIESDGVEFRAALPASHFTLVEAMSAGEDAKFSITKTGLRVSGKGFIVSLPATQAEDKHFDMVPSFVKSLPKPVYECGCEIDQFASIADNLFTLYVTNTNFILTTKADKLSISFQTSSGSASDALSVETKSSKPVRAGVDPRLLRDLLNLAKTASNVRFRITDRVLVFIGEVGKTQVMLSCARAE